jgi:hypothetical protein
MHTNNNNEYNNDNNSRKDDNDLNIYDIANDRTQNTMLRIYVWGPHHNLSYTEGTAIRMGFWLYRACTHQQVETTQWQREHTWHLAMDYPS